MKRKSIFLILLLLCAIMTKAQESVNITFNEGLNTSYILQFTTIEGTDECSVKAYRPANNATALEIPTMVEINGSNYYVTKILERGFRNATKFNSITLPDSLKIIENNAFYNCSGLTGNLIIPNSVTSIGDYAFYGCHNMKGTLTLSEKLITIGQYAFAKNGTNMGFTGNLVIPNSVTSIGAYAFNYCSNFKGSLTLSENLITIDSYAFNYCGFTSIKFEKNSKLETIGQGAFYSCSSLSGNLTIPNSVTSIGNSAFYNCYGFKGNLTLSENLATIGNTAFYNCYGFTSNLVIPNSVTSIGASAFYNCYGFKGSLTLSENITTINNNTFRGCYGFKGNLVIPNSVTTIGTYAFYNCYGFNSSLLLSENLTSIDASAFSCDNSYTMKFTGSLTIPNKVTSIGNYAFQYCSNLEGSLTLSAALQTIGSYAFASCSKFNTMICLATTPPTAQSTTFNGHNIAILYVPEESVDLYYEEAPWYDFWIMELVEFNEFEVEVEDENGDVLYSLIYNTTEDYSGVSVKIRQKPTTNVELIIPETVWHSGENFTYTVTEIEENAFKDCSSFTSIEIPQYIRSIGENAFSGCSNVSKIISHRNTPPTTGNNCFEGISNKTTLLVSATVINNYDVEPWNRFDIKPLMVNHEHNVSDENGNKLYSLLFSINEDYSGLSVKIGTKPTSTYRPALNIPEEFLGFPVTIIEDNAFSECYYFSSVNIPNSVTYIGERAFAGYSNNSSVSSMNLAGDLVIPNSVTYIGDYAFYLCCNLTSLSFEENSKIETIGDYAFAGKCYANIYGWDYNYDGITGNDYYLYDYTMNFKGELNIPNSLTSIGEHAFYLCDDFTSIKFENNSKLDSIGNYAFAGYSQTDGVYDESDNYIYVTANVPMKFKGNLSIPNSVSYIGEYAFQYCSFDNIIIGDNTTTSRPLALQRYSFSDCSANSLKIGNNVTSIGDYAFAGSLEEKYDSGNDYYHQYYEITTPNFSGELIIPNSVTSIGNYAFYLCDKFTSLKFEEGSNLESIGDYAFAGTIVSDYYNDYNNDDNDYNNYTPYSMGLSNELIIPNSVTSIGEHAFYLCTNLYKLKFESDSKLETIGDYAFAGVISDNGDAFNMGLSTELVIPNSVISIGSYAFYFCNNLTSLKFEENSKLEIIGDYAFSSYNWWDSNMPMNFKGELKIPNSVTSIGNYAFYNCDKLTSLKFEENSNLETIGNEAFSSCNGFTGELIIPNSVTSIGNEAFSSCNGFTGELVIPNSVTSIGNEAFSSCNGFTKLKFEDDSNLETIGNYAFWQMNFADSLVLPASLKSIGSSAFQYNKKLSTVTSLATAAPSLGSDVFSYISDSTKTLIIPEGSVLSYLEKGWYNYFSMPESMTLSGKCGDNLTWEISTNIGILEIQGTGAMYDYNNSNNIAPWRNVSKYLKEFVIEEGITHIGNYAFYNCDSIKCDFNIPNSVTSIGDDTFYDCDGFTGELVIPNSVTSIGSSAFGSGNGFTKLKFEDDSNLETIGNSAFFSCNGFTGELVIPNNVTSIGSSAFANCNKFTSLKFEENSNLKTIGSSAFGSCNGFTGELIIPNSVTSIGDYAFSSCYFNGELIIPNSITYIGNEAFNGDNFSKIICHSSTPFKCYEEEWYDYEIGEWIYSNMYFLGTTYYVDFPTIYVPASAVSSYQKTWTTYKDYIYQDGLPTFTKDNGIVNNTSNWYILENGSRRYRLPKETEDVLIDASMIIKDSETLNVKSVSLTGKGDITIKEGGQLICDNINSAIKVEKNIEAHSTTGNTTWTTISSPFGKDLNSSDVNNLENGNYSLYRYDEPSSTWQNYKNSANNGFTNFEAGRGYLYSNSDNTTLVFNGTTNTKNVSYELSAKSESLTGFHLIGNPYTHNITWDNLVTTTNIDKIIITLSNGSYYFSNNNYIQITSSDGSIDTIFNSAGKYELTGVYGKELTIYSIHNSYTYGQSVNINHENGKTLLSKTLYYYSSYGTSTLSTFTVSDYSQKDILAEGYYSLSNEGAWGVKYGEETEIKPCQGILIKTTEEGVLNINSSVTATRGNAKRNSASNILAISVANKKYSDIAYISFNEGFGLDKIAHENENIPMVYIPGRDADYAIAIKDKDFVEIPVNFEAGAMGEYTIKVSQKDCGFKKLYLYDKVTDKTINILKNEYTFFATSSDDPDRFVLKAVNDEVLDNYAFINNGNLVISNIKGSADIDIFDVLGRKVLQNNCSDDEYQIATDQFSAGVYIIRKSDENGVKTQKIVID